MDDKHQYVLAEPTRSLSLNDSDEYDKTDVDEKVYLDPRILEPSWGICLDTIQVFSALDNSINISTNQITANQDCCIMDDMSAITRYADRPQVSGWPYMRFFAEVLIKSPLGQVIGTYCVVDNRPRDGLDQKDFKALTEIAPATMKHLDLVGSEQILAEVSYSLH